MVRPKRPQSFYTWATWAVKALRRVGLLTLHEERDALNRIKLLRQGIDPDHPERSVH